MRVVHLNEVVTSTIQSTILVRYSLLTLCVARGDTGAFSSPPTKFLWISDHRVSSKSSPLSGVLCWVEIKLLSRCFYASTEPALRARVTFLTLMTCSLAVWLSFFCLLTPSPERLEMCPECRRCYPSRVAPSIITFTL